MDDKKPQPKAKPRRSLHLIRRSIALVALAVLSVVAMNSPAAAVVEGWLR